jgi:hypothetical protein
MTIRELRRLIEWCDTAEDNAGFWRRMYYAASALDLRTQLLVQALVAQVGTLPHRNLKETRQ